MSWLILLMTVLLYSQSLEAQTDSLKLADAKVKGNRVYLVLDRTRIPSSQQIHVFLDGVFVKAVSGQSQITVDLKGSGTYKIDLIEATHEFALQLKRACLRIEVTIPGGGTPKEGVCSP